MKNSSNIMHVMVENPVTLRKEILKSAIDSTKLLKHYEDTRYTRAKKVAAMNDFKENLDKLKELLNNLQSTLPIIEEKEEAGEEEVKTVKPKVIKGEMKPMKAKPKSRLDIELEEIEEKLRRIEI